MALSIDDLLQVQTLDEIKAIALLVADSVGLPVDTWYSGEPTNELIHIDAHLENVTQTLMLVAIKGGFRTEATAGWLTLHAANTYNVTRIAQTFATPEVTVTNNSGALLSHAAGSFVVQNTATLATYVNTEVINIANGANDDIDFIAQQGGSDGSAAAAAITTVVTTTLGVTVTNAAAATGTDEQSDADLAQLCLDKLGALSPNGADDAYSYFAKTATRADGSNVDINRVRATANAGTVTVVMAGVNGAVIGADVALANTAIQENAVPLGITANVSSATESAVVFTYQMWVPDTVTETDAEIEALVLQSLTDYFLTIPIGGFQKVAGAGFVWHDVLEARISDSVADAFSVEMTVPAVDVALLSTEVATLSTITASITRVSQ